MSNQNNGKETFQRIIKFFKPGATTEYTLDTTDENSTLNKVV